MLKVSVFEFLYFPIFYRCGIGSGYSLKGTKHCKSTICGAFCFSASTLYYSFEYHPATEPTLLTFSSTPTNFAYFIFADSQNIS